MAEGRAPLKVLGHRGSPLKEPENKLASFIAALADGADGVELDLQLTWDDVLAVRHDPDVSGKALRDLTFGQLLELEPATPSLDDVLAALSNHPGALVNLELKPALPPDGREARLVEALAALPDSLSGSTWVSSFDPHVLARLGRLGVPVPLGLLAAEEAHLDLLPCLPVTAVHPHHRLVTEERMHAWRSAGLAVHVWTVNDLDEARRLAALGVDSIIGDDPAGLVRALSAGA